MTMSKIVLNDLTIVIATIGEDTLFVTLDSISKSYHVPKEIIVSIPDLMLTENLKNLLGKYKIVKIIQTSVSGQVFQRIEAFKKVSTKLVLQLDTDIKLKPNTIIELYNSIINKGPHAVIGVILMPHDKKINIANQTLNLSFFRSIYYFFIDGGFGKRHGKIYKSGAVEQLDPQKKQLELIQVDWLPGGCCIHWTKNLIIKNYFPFRGKAYCEDILHTYELRLNGISLWVNPKVILNTEILSYIKLNLKDFFKFLFNDSRARSLVVKKMHLSYSRMLIFYIIIIINYINKRLFSNHN
jgi:hypothetical protein